MNRSRPREQLTVICCCYNEALNVRDTAREFLSVEPNLPVDLRVIFVDDASTDRTPDIIEELCSNQSHFTALYNQTNLGLGASILKAYHLVDANSWVTDIPGDNQFRFSSIENLLKLRHQYDIILGYPENPEVRPVPRRIASDIYMRLCRRLFGLDVTYLNGMQLYRIEAFRDLPMVTRGHGFTAELLSKALIRNPELKVGEAPFSLRLNKTANSEAFSLTSISEAVFETILAYRSVQQFRVTFPDDH